MTPTVMTTEVVRFTLLGRGRPLAGQTFTMAAPPGCWIGLEVQPRRPRGELLLACRLGLDLMTVVEGPEPEAMAVPEVLMATAAGAHQALRDLAGDLRGSSWAVQAWASIPGMSIPGQDPGQWMHVCTPWTTGIRPLTDYTSGYDADDGTAGHAVRFWESQTRTGAQPWPEDWPAVTTLGGVPQPPRFGANAHYSYGLADLAPPEADVLPAPRGGVLAGH